MNKAGFVNVFRPRRAFALGTNCGSIDKAEEDPGKRIFASSGLEPLFILGPLSQRWRRCATQNQNWLIWTVAWIVISCTLVRPVRAQSDPAPQSSGQDSQSQSDTNPPISGIDQPSLGARFPTRSFLVPGAHVSEALDTNAGQTAGTSAINGVTRVLGSLMLQKIGGRSVTAFDYVGGVAFYTGVNTSTSQIHQFDAEHRILWRTGAFSLRDRFSYLPEGSFGFGAYGESGAYNLGLGGIGYMGGTLGQGLGGLFGLGEFGSLGQAPRIDNLAIADVTQSLSARSSVTVAGGYEIVHFTNDTAGLIDSNQTTVQVGYDYKLSRKSQIALVYGFQHFQYPNIPGSNSFDTHVVSLMYAYRISGRMDFLIGAGPQVTQIHNSLLFGGSSDRITVSARAALRYRFPRTSIGIYYDRYNSSGSGYFVGAVSDVVRFSVSRPLTRLWTGTADIGYAHNSALQSGQLNLLPPSTNTFQYVYAGAAVRRPLGRQFAVFFSYQFNDLQFNGSTCTAGGSCASQRHVVAAGLDWHPRPIRLD
jgi:hypothetical protein